MISDKEQIVKLLDLMYNSVVSDGGDGDAIWYVKHFKLFDVKEIVEEHNVSKEINWKIEIFKDYISWGIDQEWIIITDSKEIYDLNNKDWSTMKIIF